MPASVEGSLVDLSHLSDQALLRGLEKAVAQKRTHLAALLADIAEIDARQIHVSAGYASMVDYCVSELAVDEDEAPQYVVAARTARFFPAIFEAVEDGRLHVAAVVMLAPYLDAENAEELLAAATHKTETEIEMLLSQRFPQPGTARSCLPPVQRWPFSLAALEPVRYSACRPDSWTPEDLCNPCLPTPRTT